MLTVPQPKLKLALHCPNHPRAETNRSATVGDLKKMNKVIKKAKAGADESKIRYKKIDKFENLQIHGYALRLRTGRPEA